MRAFILSALAPSAAAHAVMHTPPPRALHGRPVKESCTKAGKPVSCQVGCYQGSCLWYQVGCMVGCDTCSLSGKEMYPTPAHVECTRHGKPVPAGMEPYANPRTITPAQRTWNVGGKSLMGDFTKFMPWSAPGASALVDPCGVASGFRPGQQYANAPPGFKVGDNGTAVLKQLANVTTEWAAGGTAEVGFGFTVNHGGGYSYRLCPKSKAPTEACFQSMPLSFATGTTTARWIDGSRADVTFPAVTVTEGTTPKGSTWRRIPIPACNCDIGANCRVKKEHNALVGAGAACNENPTCSNAKDYQTGCKKCTDKASGAPEWSCDVCCAGCTLTKKASGSYCQCGAKPPGPPGPPKPPQDMSLAYEQQPNAPKRCPTGTQFPPPADNLYGYEDVPPATFVDTLRVPETAGEYILSWRWDCEQTPQIWNTCADITIKKA